MVGRRRARENVSRRIIFHGERRVATVYGSLNDVLYVPPDHDWRAIQAHDDERWPSVLTVLHHD